MPVRPLIIFGLRGTLLERLHTARVPIGMPPATNAVGMHQIWLRPHTMEVLQDLSSLGCDLAIWSSTTTRNTFPLVQTLFSKYPKDSVTDTSGAKGVHTVAPFKFIWTREQTTADIFRRSLPADAEDENATIKDLTLLFEQFSAPDGTPPYIPALNSTTTTNTTAEAATEEGGKGKGKGKGKAAKGKGKKAAGKKGEAAAAATTTTTATTANGVALDQSALAGAVVEPTSPNPDYVFSPDRTIIIDDTTSKCRGCAGNFLWMRSFGAASDPELSQEQKDALLHDDELRRLVPFVKEKIIPSRDVRDVLPARL